ncbi:hypothetical protein D3C75_1192460 [compost metagenome]
MSFFNRGGSLGSSCVQSEASLSVKIYLVLGSSANITYTGNLGIELNLALTLTISDSEYPSTVISQDEIEQDSRGYFNSVTM